MVIIKSCASVVLLLLIGCASQQYVPKENEEFYGTWNNRTYPHIAVIPKDSTNPLYGVPGIICSPDGNLKGYDPWFNTGGMSRTFVFTITDKWSDSDGYIILTTAASAMNTANSTC